MPVNNISLCQIFVSSTRSILNFETFEKFFDNIFCYPHDKKTGGDHSNFGFVFSRTSTIATWNGKKSCGRDPGCWITVPVSYCGGLKIFN
ncbi:hypothetical protein BpHYR1_006115 [Brachionus plicatilis]|uniref:Uncharacterized protein n=1 Tax=Brachionus plicatilis TaxID=10195 RepID=A0A3M7R4V3_BRAPC|nr:hypothetical protein BpHYR1_006115 [Brachionus plicatilis]